MNDWWMEALEDTLAQQRAEVEELRAEYERIESVDDTSDEHIDQVADCLLKWLPAIDDLESAEKYVESQRQYA